MLRFPSNSNLRASSRFQGRQPTTLYPILRQTEVLGNLSYSLMSSGIIDCLAEYR